MLIAAASSGIKVEFKTGDKTKKLMSETGGLESKRLAKACRIRTNLAPSRSDTSRLVSRDIIIN